jgi:hypothetical protein
MPGSNRNHPAEGEHARRACRNPQGVEVKRSVFGRAYYGLTMDPIRRGRLAPPLGASVSQTSVTDVT